MSLFTAFRYPFPAVWKGISTETIRECGELKSCFGARKWYISSYVTKLLLICIYTSSRPSYLFITPLRIETRSFSCIVPLVTIDGHYCCASGQSGNYTGTRRVSSMSNSYLFFEAQSYSVKNGGVELIARNGGSGIKSEEWWVLGLTSLNA